jgi:FkbM family methyltransferase
MPLKASFQNTLNKTEKLRRVLAEPSYRRALAHGVAATTEHENVTFPREYSTVIDVGANRGQFALFALHRFPNAQLLCFEPLGDPHHKLVEVVGGDPRVRTQQCAIGSAAGRLRLNITHSDDSSSLLKPTLLQLQHFPKTNSISSVDVDVKTLDDVTEAETLTPPYLLKIDVQGFELEVIKGAKRLLKEDGDLLVEASFVELYSGQALADEVVATLLAQGYRLLGIFSLIRGLDGVPLQGDFLFSRETLSASMHQPMPVKHSRNR